ncbi:hypothetical protein MP228_005068 [Amoeboaphelidium protococcarum]|nr:hypothetical protein MP228_005068 [Amoeboaphelidium protococcarum]
MSKSLNLQLQQALRAVSQRIPGVVFILGALLLFLGPLYLTGLYWVVVALLKLCLVTNAVRLAVGLVITAIKTRKHIDLDWMAKYRDVVASWEGEREIDVKPSAVKHVIIIPNYKEDRDVLCETLDTLAHHYQAKNCYKVIMAMEQGEKGCEEKAEGLIKEFGHRFFDMKYTVHPSGIAGEARGKSSNVAWAATYYHQNWMLANDSKNEVITVMDADTHLTSKYFDCLTYKYCIATEDEQKRMLFAPTLIFDRNANDVPFVVRLADICWSIGLMSNFQLVVKFPCSVYTITMQLAERVGFWDAGPEAIGEDMHMALKCWTKLGMNLIATPIYVPASCSCVQADTYLGSVNARFQQSLRHLWGALDFGYAFSSIIIEGCWYKSPLRSFLCVYLLFEIFFQPYFGFYHLTAQIIFPQSMVGIGSFVIEYVTYINLALIPPAIIVAFAYERYHYLACHYRASILKMVKDKMSQESLANSVELASPLKNCASDNSDRFAHEGDLMIRDVDHHDAIDEFAQSRVAFRKWYQIIDWAGLPFCLFAYYLIPGINAMMWQLVTNKLDYKVSLKPTTRPAGATGGNAVNGSADGVALTKN